MEEKTIMLVCSAGMSTSMLVQKMEKAADEQGKNYNIFATSASEADGKLDRENVSAILLGPQIQYMKEQFVEKGQKLNVPVDVINMQDYGMFNGQKVLKDVEQLIQDYNN